MNYRIDSYILWHGSDISDNCNALGNQREDLFPHRTSDGPKCMKNSWNFQEFSGGHHPRYEVSGRPDIVNNTNVPIHPAAILCGGSIDCKHMQISSPEVYDQIYRCTEIVAMVRILRVKECAVLDHNTQLIIDAFSALLSAPCLAPARECMSLRSVKDTTGHSGICICL